MTFPRLESIVSAASTVSRTLAAPCFLWEIDACALYTHLAADVCGVLGYYPEELVGRSFFDSLVPEAVDDVVDWCVAARANHQSFLQFEGLHFCKNGESIVLETIAIALFHEDGSFRGYRGIHRDISDRLRLEQTFQKLLHRERWAQAIARIRQSLNLHQILKTTIQEVQNILRTDRVSICRLGTTLEIEGNRAEPPDPGIGPWMGESATAGGDSRWLSVLQSLLCSPHTSEISLQTFRQGQVVAIANVDHADLEAWQLNLLHQSQVNALVMVPIFQQEHLWGLLVAHHCAAPRLWHPLEIELLRQMATEVGIATYQSESFEALEYSNRELHRLVHLDELTEVGNRRCFEEYLEQQWQGLSKVEESMALIFCDVDHFKIYNDTQGHLAGDRCLSQVAAAIRQAVRRSADLVARYGGEEFVVLLPNTQLTGALQVARRIHKTLQTVRLPHPASPIVPHITLSLGVSSIQASTQTSPTQLIAAADRALYQAKAQGRNRIVVGSIHCPNNLDLPA